MGGLVTELARASLPKAQAGKGIHGGWSRVGVLDRRHRRISNQSPHQGTRRSPGSAQLGNYGATVGRQLRLA
jgi:hypothetical protein